MPEDVFWNKTPTTLQIYFKAHNQKKENESKEWAQKMWVAGIYTKAAIGTSVFTAGLWDGKHKPPQYPKCPYIDEKDDDPSNYTEDQIQAERMRVLAYFKSLGKK